MKAKTRIPGWRGRSLYRLEIQVKVGRRKNRRIKYKLCLVVAAILVLAEPEGDHCIKYKWYLVVAAVIVLGEPEEGHCIKYKWPLDGVKIGSGDDVVHKRFRLESQDMEVTVSNTSNSGTVSNSLYQTQAILMHTVSKAVAVSNTSNEWRRCRWATKGCWEI